MIIAKDTVEVNGRRFLVSTADTFDHGLETMVFNEGKWTDLYVDRYSTIDQAFAGHNRAVKGLQDGTLPLYGQD